MVSPDLTAVFHSASIIIGRWLNYSFVFNGLTISIWQVLLFFLLCFLVITVIRLLDEF